MVNVQDNASHNPPTNIWHTIWKCIIAEPTLSAHHFRCAPKLFGSAVGYMCVWLCVCTMIKRVTIGIPLRLFDHLFSHSLHSHILFTSFSTLFFSQFFFSSGILWGCNKCGWFFGLGIWMWVHKYRAPLSKCVWYSNAHRTIFIVKYPHSGTGANISIIFFYFFIFFLVCEIPFLFHPIRHIKL